MLPNLTEKIKVFSKNLNRREDVFIIALIILVGFGGFGLGRLSVTTQQKTPVSIISSEKREPSFSRVNSRENPRDTIGGSLVASVNGSKYHLPWCPSVPRINEENKIWFDSEEEAKAAGYEPAANCPGL